MANEIYVTRINAGGELRQIDYNALANLPTSDKELSTDGGFADSKVVGDEIKRVEGLIITPTLEGLGIEATAAELNYMDGVTSNVQTQLNAKQKAITGAAETIVENNLTADKVLVSDKNGKVGVSAVTAEEIGYLSGLVVNAQEQFDATARSLIELHARPVNNNILINSNFANPVNQRGNDAYQTPGYGAYTIDRWKSTISQVDIIKNKYITIKHHNAPGYEQRPVFVQYIDYLEQYVNKDLTASLKYCVKDSTDDGVTTLSVKTDAKVIGELELKCDGEWHIETLTINCGEIAEYLAFVITLNDKNSTMYLEWAKLEVGNVATPYIARLPGEELQLCQLYYQAFDVTSGNARGINDNEFHFYATVPHMMRIASPDINTDGLTIRCCDLEHGGTKVIDGAYFGSDSTAVNTFTNKLFLQCCLPEGHSITVGHHPYVDGVVILDAEI